KFGGNRSRGKKHRLEKLFGATPGASLQGRGSDSEHHPTFSSLLFSSLLVIRKRDRRWSSVEKVLESSRLQASRKRTVGLEEAVEF
ncbi:hypothetical protein TorRG33x02_007900, partial [Trema orientale]